MDQLLALRVFVRIAETGAFSKAADTLAIPRPTVTKLVQDLEAHLGTKLLQRTTRRVSVTPEGAAYYERAARLIGELEEMDANAASARVQLRADGAASPYRTDEGHLILDCAFGPIEDPGDLAALLSVRAGIVEHGLFLGIATDVFIGSDDGVRHLVREPRRTS